MNILVLFLLNLLVKLHLKIYWIRLIHGINQIGSYQSYQMAMPLWHQAHLYSKIVFLFIFSRDFVYIYHIFIDFLCDQHIQRKHFCKFENYSDFSGSIVWTSHIQFDVNFQHNFIYGWVCVYLFNLSVGQLVSQLIQRKTIYLHWSKMFFLVSKCEHCENWRWIQIFTVNCWLRKYTCCVFDMTFYKCCFLLKYRLFLSCDYRGSQFHFQRFFHRFFNYFHRFFFGKQLKSIRWFVSKFENTTNKFTPQNVCVWSQWLPMPNLITLIFSLTFHLNF